ncbi:MAG TPA: ferritin-like domain-containing protein [Thermoanaerobaculia bacterium]|nr:ferritin-like domain-containing protein [Thermoanaerobaculia bacterium]
MTAGAIAVDGGDLPLGGGLLSLVRPALTLLEPDGVLAVLSRSSSVAEDLASWCRAERHEYLGAEAAGDRMTRHLVRRGRFSVHRPAVPVDPHLPERADASTGFAPNGSVVEPGGPRYPFDLVERDRVTAPEVAELYEQAVAAQWSAARDIPWSTIPRHEAALELAVRQVMTFLAENELSALYVPSRFIARLHPAYVGVAMFLATQMQDESRHIDVFLRRAHATGSPPAISSASTSRSLHSLLEIDNFTEASFLLSVLGEGTFLDLLAFVERFAPDEATAELARRARIDEARHVHFGLSHVRHALAHDGTLYPRLEAAVRHRAATLAGIGGVPAPVQDALTIYAAGASDPRRVARGHEAFRELLATMHEGRIRRLRSAGFTAEQAAAISDLHTPNFM